MSYVFIIFKGIDYITEALKYLESDQFITVPGCIRMKPRQPGGLRKV